MWDPDQTKKEVAVKKRLPELTDEQEMRRLSRQVRDNPKARWVFGITMLATGECYITHTDRFSKLEMRTQRLLREIVALSQNRRV